MSTPIESDVLRLQAIGILRSINKSISAYQKITGRNGFDDVSLWTWLDTDIWSDGDIPVSASSAMFEIMGRGLDLWDRDPHDTHVVQGEIDRVSELVDELHLEGQGGE